MRQLARHPFPTADSRRRRVEEMQRAYNACRELKVGGCGPRMDRVVSHLSRQADGEPRHIRVFSARDEDNSTRGRPPPTELSSSTPGGLRISIVRLICDEKTE